MGLEESSRFLLKGSFKGDIGPHKGCMRIFRALGFPISTVALAL